MGRNRILIVEDEQVVAEHLRQSLTSEGYDVVGVAQSGEQAVTEGERSRPDLVIMDIMLPGEVDGIAAAQQLQPFGVPVVFLTAYSDRHLIDRAKHTRPLGYIIKPAKSREVAAVVQLAFFKRDEDRARDREDHKRLLARREADDQFGRMVAGVTDYAIFTLDPAGNINSWNAGAERINGYSTNEVLGTPHAILFTPEDRERNIPYKELQQAGEHGTADDTRWLVRKDGERYWAEGVLTAILDDDGVLTGFSKVTRDATERKKLHDALTDQALALRIAMRAARMGTWHWDILTNTDTLDDNLRELFGLGPGEDVATIEDFYALVHPDDRERVKAAFEETRHHGVHLDTEFRVPQKDGTERWLIDQGEVFTLDGKPAYMTGACVDITQRKEAEQALRVSEERFRLFVNNVREYALIQLDTEGRITTWNSGAEAVLGFTAADIIGKPSSCLFVPEDVAAEEPQKEMKQAVTLGRAMDERWHLRKDGSRFWCSGVLMVMHDDEGRLRGFAKVMRDETERRTTSEQLKASLAEKEVMLKEIHHRVKNNLQVITSLLTLQADAVENETVREMFDDACNRVRSIGEIHELLYRSPDLAHVDFGEYLKKLGQNLEAFYGEPDRVRLNIAAEVDLPLAEAVPCGLIVNELVTNCFKHAFPDRRSGMVDVSLRCEGSECVLKVSDDGIGVPSGFSFEEATSLGLKLVSVLSKQLGGDIRVQRTTGTQVSVVFLRSTNEQSEHKQ